MELQVNKEWCKVSDATVRFTVASTYQRSSWDWVAIYKVAVKVTPSKFWQFCLATVNIQLHFSSEQVGFRHHKDYQAYVWAKGEHVTQVCSILKFTTGFSVVAECKFNCFSFSRSHSQRRICREMTVNIY